MAVLHRRHARVSLPPDFGLGLAVTAILGGLMLLIVLGAAAMPGRGPSSEPRPPETGTYVDFAPSAPPAVLPTP